MRSATLSGIVLAAAVGVLAAAAFAQDATASKSAESWYLWSNEGKPAGYFHVLKKPSAEALAPVLFEHEFRIKWRDKQLSLRMQTLCKEDECFSPVKIVSEGKGDDEFGNFTATIARMAGSTAGKLTATRDGRKIEMDIPERTVTDFVLFEIVRSRPFDKEKVFEFNSLEASELNLKKDHKLTYLGEEELEVGGQMMKLHKFEQTGGGIQPVHYWVNERRELLRVLMDGRKEFLLTTKEKATAAMEQ